MSAILYGFSIPDVKYEDEYGVMCAIQNKHENQNLAGMIRHEVHLQLDSELKIFENKEDLIVKSNKLREQGNRLFKAGPKQNSLPACRFYTKAIFTAPLGKSLALAHANRAAALLEFGYIQQAYDDCECALELGYPENLRVKIWMRQANCANQLGDVERLKQHLDTLNDHKLTANFTERFEELKQDLQRLLESADGQAVVANDNRSKVTTELHRGTQKIINVNNKDPSMVATEYIPEKALIFREEFISFVPLLENSVCHQCAVTLLIPFPCYQCRGKVVYCSLKCRRSHQPIHSNECFGYKRNFFSTFVPRQHLAFRLVTEHFPQVAAMLRYTPSAKQIWSELTVEGGLVHTSNSGYAQVLRMKTNFNKQSVKDILGVAKDSWVLVEYLSDYTNFFDMSVFTGTKITRNDWKLILSSLILRHYGQICERPISFTSIQRSALVSIDFDLMCDKLWTTPWHVRRGYLYQFKACELKTLTILPYQSLCRHSCEKSFVTKYSGRMISTYACKSIEAGEELFDSYFMDYRSANKKERRRALKIFNSFKCKCSQCTRNPDVEEYTEQFRRFRCEKANCRKPFTSTSSVIENAMTFQIKRIIKDWSREIICPYCKQVQSNLHKLEMKIHELSSRVKYQEQRHQLFKTYEALDNHLLDLNCLKVYHAIMLLELLYPIDFDRLRTAEFVKLSNITKFALQGLAAMFGSNSVYYVSTMTYFWDIIALGKYNPKQDEMNEMLQAIEICSDEMQQVFKNYYHDFIAPHLK